MEVRKKSKLVANKNWNLKKQIEKDPEDCKELREIGMKFSEENKAKHNNFAIKKVCAQLARLRIPYVTEKVVIVPANEFFPSPKLYILDFYIPAPLNFIIEVDGNSHYSSDKKEYDRVRDKLTDRKGLGPTLRLPHSLVVSSSFSLLKEITKRNSLVRRMSALEEQKSKDRRKKNVK